MTRSITKKLLATAAVSAFLACTPVVGDANAQDGWHGLYLGNHTGYEWSNADLAFTAPGAVNGATAFNSSLEDSGLALGLQAGLNHQIGMLVVGVEADITFLNDKDSVQVITGQNWQTVRENMDFVGTIRGRVGLAVANALLYFTGGYAFGQVDHEVEFRGPGLSPLNADEGSSSGGYALGGGGEMALGVIMGLPMSAKLEYMYINLDDSTMSTAATASWAATRTNFDNDTQQVRLGVNVQLGGMGH